MHFILKYYDSNLKKKNISGKNKKIKNRVHVTNPGLKFAAAAMAPSTDRYSHCQLFNRIIFITSRYV